MWNFMNSFLNIGLNCGHNLTVLAPDHVYHMWERKLYNLISMSLNTLEKKNENKTKQKGILIHWIINKNK